MTVHKDPRTDTARPWKFTEVSRRIEESYSEGSILDFGCGKYCMQVKSFREQGRDIDGYDLWWDGQDPPLEGLYSPSRPPPRKYDLLSVSNVLNVQETVEDLLETLRSVKSFLATGGTALFNYPVNPRKMGWNSSKMHLFMEANLGSRVLFERGLWVWEP